MFRHFPQKSSDVMATHLSQTSLTGSRSVTTRAQISVHRAPCRQVNTKRGYRALFIENGDFPVGLTLRFACTALRTRSSLPGSTWCAPFFMFVWPASEDLKPLPFLSLCARQETRGC